MHFFIICTDDLTNRVDLSRRSAPAVSHFIFSVGKMNETFNLGSINGAASDDQRPGLTGRIIPLSLK